MAFSIQYATASVAGNLAYETINLGGIVIPKQAIGMVKTAGSGLQESSCDGIFVSLELHSHDWSAMEDTCVKVN